MSGWANLRNHDHVFGVRTKKKKNAMKYVTLHLLMFKNHRYVCKAKSIQYEYIFFQCFLKQYVSMNFLNTK